MKIVARISFVLLMCIVNGCSMYTAPKVDPVKAPKSFKNRLRIQNVGLNPHWWKNFKDPNLNHLVDKAISNNLRYQIAKKNINIAHTYATQAFLNRLPNLSLGGIQTDFNFSDNSLSSLGHTLKGIPTQNADFGYLYGSVSYELDIWNQKYNINQMAKVNVAVKETESRAVKLSVISEVVNTYFQIAVLDAMIATYDSQYRLGDSSLDIAKERNDRGLTNSINVDNARIDQERLVRDRNVAVKRRKWAENYLAYLLGEYPESFSYHINPAATHVNFNSLLPVTVPAQVLGNRPDVQRAFLHILSFDYFKKQTLAGFLPSFNLFGYYGGQSLSFMQLAGNSMLFWYGATVMESLTNLAKNAVRYERSKEMYQQAALSYRDTVLNAFKEVDNALVAYNEDSKNLSAHRKILKDTKSQLRLATEQYKTGGVDYNTYLQAKINMLKAKYSLQRQNIIMYRDIVQIYKTLGLGGDVTLNCIMACQPKQIASNTLPAKTK